jgi:hypothetical protein
VMTGGIFRPLSDSRPPHVHVPTQNQAVVFAFRSYLVRRQMRLDLSPLLNSLIAHRP